MNATQTQGSRITVPTEASGSERVPSHIEFDSDQMIEVSDNDIQSDVDPNRPHVQADDSNAEISGALQSNIDTLCTLPSISWASKVIKFENGYADRVLLIVSSFLS